QPSAELSMCLMLTDARACANGGRPMGRLLSQGRCRLWYPCWQIDWTRRWASDGGRQTMRSTAEIRLELLAALSQLSQLRPEWRLGQTLANLAMTAGRLDPGGVWDLEDEEALAAARTLVEQYSKV